MIPYSNYSRTLTLTLPFHSKGPSLHSSIRMLLTTATFNNNSQSHAHSHMLAIITRCRFCSLSRLHLDDQCICKCFLEPNTPRADFFVILFNPPTNLSPTIL